MEPANSESAGFSGSVTARVYDVTEGGGLSGRWLRVHAGNIIPALVLREYAG